MRILLIHPKINFDNMEPLSLLYLATVLSKQGHEARVLDHFPGDLAHTLKTALEYKPDLIGYGFESPGLESTRNLHGLLIKHLPRAFYCAGGVHITAMPEITLRQLPVHFGVLGEAEQSLSSIVQYLERGEDIHGQAGIAYIQDDEFHQTSVGPFIENLDDIPIIDRSLLYHHPFYLLPPGNIRGLVIPRSINMLASRGCPHSCIFCESSLTMGKKIRIRSVGNVMREIQNLHARYRANAVYFVDDVFTQKKEWFKEFCLQFKNSGLPVSWACQSRANSLDEEMIDLMAESGCLQVDMGIESGDPAVLKNLRKGETPEQFIQTALLLKKYKIRLLASFVLGAPGESDSSTEETARLIRRIKPSICQYFTLIPYPGTPLHRQALKNGWINNLSFSSRFSQKEWNEGALTCGLDPRKQVLAKKRLQRLTMVRDHKNLVLGWFRYPAYVWQFAALFLARFFFLKVLMSSLRHGNPILYINEIYRAFNKRMMGKIRKETSRGK